ncbi:MAG TPA: hypothetical protein VGM83_21380 [Devosiaceae bacterium]|jgi:hypothetical protein
MHKLFSKIIAAAGLSGLLLAAGPAMAQEAFKPDFRDLALGKSAADLSPADYDVFACGSDGGPPLAQLTGWTDFAKCAPDARGLHEVYVAFGTDLKAMADRVQDQFHDEPWYKKFSGTRVAGFPVVMSMLFDDAGIARGFRVVTDQRAPIDERAHAYMLPFRVKPRFDGWVCTDTPPADGETPVGKVFINQQCSVTVGPKLVTLDTHLFRKRGQTGLDTNGQPVRGEFESLTRWETWDKAFLDKTAAK